MPLFLVACASTSKTETKEASVAEPSKQGVQVDKVTPGTVVDTTQSQQVTQLLELQKKSIYFDFDSFDIKLEYREIIQQQSDFLKSNAVIATLEGNADERGSSEYNLALGSKRAEAVKKSLGFFGVNKNQLNAVSFGEEKPKLTCHEESCWAENRRVDFNITAGN
jgi:peptidoglycan-associated lipoprotein